MARQRRDRQLYADSGADSVGVTAVTLTTANPISILGLVTSFNAKLSFMVGGNTFNTTGSASFLNG